MKIEKLFSYGTLRYKAVQIATFGRELEGKPDRLVGFSLSMVKINDSSVVATSGEEEPPIITMTNLKTDHVDGMVFDISAEELNQADTYEVSEYKRIRIRLESGFSAWVYVNAYPENTALYAL